MNLIITMAGKYLRFKKAGYTLPKFLLPVKKGQTIFQEIMEQFVSGYTFEHIVFVANENDFDHKVAIEKAIRDSGINQYDLLFIGDTKGQAETALAGINLLKQKQVVSQKILIHNIDTVLYDRDMQEIDRVLDKYDGFIDVFEASEECYSFVLTDDQNLITDIKEKEVISNQATAFANMQAYCGYYGQLKTSREYYISFIYELMLRDKKQVATIPNMTKTVIMGTPEEYEMHKNNLPA
jgi:NDP-sugar pyrophosphorylase family protein